MRPSLVRSKTAPHFSNSRTRSGASLACSSAMRQLLTYCPPRIVSAKWTFQLSRSSTLASAAAMPPSAMTVWALPRRDLHTRPTDTPAAEASMAARRPAPPAPITITSCSCVSESIIKASSRQLSALNYQGFADSCGLMADSSDDSQIAPDARGAKADVQVRETDSEQRDPRPFHVFLVEHGAATPHLVAEIGLAGVAGATEALEPAADEMAYRIAAERERGQADDVCNHDQRAEPDAELMSARGIAERIQRRPAKRQERVPGQ